MLSVSGGSVFCPTCVVVWVVGLCLCVLESECVCVPCGVTVCANLECYVACVC